jgi:hypothetical protein
VEIAKPDGGMRKPEAMERDRVRFRNLRQRNIGIDLAAETAGSAHGP